MLSVIVSPFSTSGEGGSFSPRRSLMLMAPDAVYVHTLPPPPPCCWPAPAGVFGRKPLSVSSQLAASPVLQIAPRSSSRHSGASASSPSRERQIPDITSFSGPSTPGMIDCSFPHSSLHTQYAELPSSHLRGDPAGLYTNWLVIAQKQPDGFLSLVSCSSKKASSDAFACSLQSFAVMIVPTLSHVAWPSTFFLVCPALIFSCGISTSAFIRYPVGISGSG